MKDEKTSPLQGSWHMQILQKLGLACLHSLSSHSMTHHAVSQPHLPVCLATRVAHTIQHGIHHILPPSPSLLPMALPVHVPPSPGKSSPDSLSPTTSTGPHTSLASFVFPWLFSHQIINANFFTGTLQWTVWSLRAGIVC